MSRRPMPEVVTWQRFTSDFRWRQGEHLSILGPTGRGKTTLARALLPLRDYVVVVATKPEDDSLTEMERQGYLRIENWPPPEPPSERPRLIFWPHELGELNDNSLADRYRDLMADVFREGQWTIYFDEAVFLSDLLSLAQPMRMLWTQGRSVGITVVSTTQRPARVPLEMYNQARHLFFFKHTEKADLDRVADMGAGDREVIRQTLVRLRPFQFLYVNTTTGAMLRSAVSLKHS